MSRWNRFDWFAATSVKSRRQRASEARKRTTAKPRHLAIEPLEERRVLSVETTSLFVGPEWIDGAAFATAVGAELEQQSLDDAGGPAPSVSPPPATAQLSSAKNARDIQLLVLPPKPVGAEVALKSVAYSNHQISLGEARVGNVLGGGDRYVVADVTVAGSSSAVAHLNLVFQPSEPGVSAIFAPSWHARSGNEWTYREPTLTGTFTFIVEYRTPATSNTPAAVQTHSVEFRIDPSAAITEIPVGNANSDPITAMRVQQRLNSLNFTASANGSPLTVDGGFGPASQNALGLFAGAVAANSSFVVSQLRVSALSAAWLNSPHAPRWIEFVDPGIPAFGPGPYLPNEGPFDLLPGKLNNKRDGETPQPERFGTSWALQVLGDAAATNLASGGSTIIVTGVSARDGNAKLYGHNSTHRAGMDIDVAIPGLVLDQDPAAGFDLRALNWFQDTEVRNLFNGISHTAYWQRVAEESTSDGIATAEQARTAINVVVPNGVQNDEASIRRLYAERSEATSPYRLAAVRYAVDNPGLGIDPVGPNRSEEAVFDEVFDILVGKRTAYNRIETLNLIKYFAEQSWTAGSRRVEKVLFNDPQMKRMVDEDGIFPDGFEVVLADRHSNHLHFELFAPTVGSPNSNQPTAPKQALLPAFNLAGSFFATTAYDSDPLSAALTPFSDPEIGALPSIPGVETPIFSRSVTSLADIGRLSEIVSTIFGRASTYLMGSGDATLQGLQDSLDGFVPSSLGEGLTATSLSAPEIAASVQEFSFEEDTVRIRIAVNADAETVQNLRLGEEATNLGLQFDQGGGEVRVVATTELDFTLVVRLDGVAPEEDNVRIEIHTLDVALSEVGLTAEGLSVDAGLLALDVANVDASGSLGVRFSSNGEQPLTGLLNGDIPLGEAFTIVPRGALQIDFSATPRPLDLGGVVVNLTGLPATFSFSLDSSDAYEGRFDLEGVTQTLSDFLQLRPEPLVGALDEVGAWLTGAADGVTLNRALEFAQGATVGQSIGIDRAWGSAVVGLARGADGGLTFNDFQEFVRAVAPALGAGGVTYANGELEFDFDFNATPAAGQVNLAFDQGIAGILDVTTSGVASLTSSVDARFRLGLDLEGFLAASNAVASGATPLAAIDGLGDAAMTVGTDFMVRLHDGSQLSVELDNAQIAGPQGRTLATVVDYLNSLAPGLLLASLTSDGRLRLEDKSLGNETFQVTRPQGGESAAAFLLGILGRDADADHVITSGSLVSLADFAYIRPASGGQIVTASASVAANNVTANARIGLAADLTAGVSGTATTSVSVWLQGDANGDGKYTLPELLHDDTLLTASFADDASFQFAVSGSLLGQQVVSAGLELEWDDFTNNSAVDLTATNATGEDLLSVSLLALPGVPDFGALFGDVTRSDSFAQIGSVLNGLAFIGEKLPLLDRSVAELIGLDATFATVAKTIADGASSSLASIESELTDAVKKHFGSESTATLSLVGPAGSRALKISLGLVQSIDEELRVNGDLGGVGGILDARGVATLAFVGGVSLTLDLGIDLNEPTQIFVFDSTSGAITAKANSSDIEFATSIGPLSASIGRAGDKGRFALDIDGLAPGVAPATFGFTLAPTPGDRYDVEQLESAITVVGPSGRLEAVLPVYVNGSKVTEVGFNLGSLDDASTLEPTGVTALEDAISNFGNLASQLQATVEGWDGIFGLVEDALDGEMFGVTLPIIGDDLKDASRFVIDLKERIFNNLAVINPGPKNAAFVQQKLFDALGPGGLQWLQERDGVAGLTPSDVRVYAGGVLVTNLAAISPTADDIRFDVHLKQVASAAQIPVDFDLGLPGFGFSIDPGSSIDLDIGFEMVVGLGMDKSEGAYIAFSNPLGGSGADLVVDIGVKLSDDFAATGELGFLQVDIEDNGSGYAGRFSASLPDRVSLSSLAGGGDLLTNPRFDSGRFVNNEFVTGGAATIDLNLTASFDGLAQFPTIQTNFVMGWSFNSASTDGGALFGDAPSVAFNDIRVEIGSFFQDFVGPIIDEINAVIAPVKDVIDFLRAPLPIIAELSGQEVTLLELGKLLFPAKRAQFEQAEEFVEAADKIVGLADMTLDDIASGATIPLGSFTLAGGFDPRTGSLDTIDPQGQQVAGQGTSQADRDTAIRNAGGGDVLDATREVNGNNGGGLSFPLIEDPKKALGLLFGRNVDLVRLDLPTFDVGYSYSQAFPVLPPFLGVTLTGRLAASANIDLGFDTRGLRQALDSGNSAQVFNGLYLDDHVQGARDLPELTLSAGIALRADVFPIPVFPPFPVFVVAGVEGGFEGKLAFDLHDRQPDGKVYIDEIGNPRLFDGGGSLNATLDATLGVKVDLGLFSITVISIAVPIVDIPIFDIRFTDDAPVEPELATNSNGVLSLNAAVAPSLATDGAPATSTTGGRSFTVRRGANDREVLVSSLGITQRYAEVDRLVFSGTGGNDEIIVDRAVTLPVELHGGDGNDRLVAGGGPSRLFGGDGSDTLIGGDADDHLEGNEGDDVIRGGRGNDVLLGGIGEDELLGELGADRLEGGSGRNRLIGGAGADEIYGGQDDDFIDGGIDSDVVYAGAGNDTVFGGDGADILHAESGNDRIEAGGANDTIYAGAGIDYIDAGDGNDYVEGGDDADTIYGGPGSDNLYGGDGADTIYVGRIDGVREEGSENRVDAGAGNDRIYGDGTTAAGFDWIIAGDGDDEVYAYGGNDYVDGGDGDDTIDAGSGSDTVFAGAEDDTIYGGDGDDYLVGGSGDDLISGQGGSDLIWGGEASFSLAALSPTDSASLQFPQEWVSAEEFRQAALPTADKNRFRVVPTLVGQASLLGVPIDGRDTLRGGDQQDWLFGGGDSDDLDGGSGDDYLDGGAGNDSVRGSAGFDVLRGGANDDILNGDDGIDLLLGDDGVDSLFAGAGENGSQAGQRVWGGEGIDYLYAYAAAEDDPAEFELTGDELRGGAGGDWLYGNLRRELLIGDGGNDTLLGDYLAGPTYATNVRADYVGASDELFGGTGEDKLYGGGGRDVLYGGADSDWLEGQDGNDQLFGEAGIDMMVLDVKPHYGELGDSFDGHGGASADDNATDILLIEGLNIGGVDQDDTITLRATADPNRQLEVFFPTFTDTFLFEDAFAKDEQRTLVANWIDYSNPAAPRTLVEQFRIAGLGGNDTIGFDRALRPLNVDRLTERSRDWVGVLDGGPGDDTLSGSEGRDRIDGGLGDDTLYGYGGSDQLWGDSGTGAVSDHDVIFGGQGNDDLIGGAGTNQLFAWSQNPDPAVIDLGSGLRGDPPSLPTPTFGVWVDPLLPGALFDSPGPGRVLEDTGLNRVLGGEEADELYGGTGLDFLYGQEGENLLFDRRGNLFEVRDEDFAGDAWKQYARSTDKVWYYGATNADDVITVDFVTEPGLFFEKHLITRLTSNNGSFSFDAQVQLAFNAVDDQGNPIWDPRSDFYAWAVASSEPLTGAALEGRLTGTAEIYLSVLGSAPLRLSIPRVDSNASLDDLVADTNEAIELSVDLAGKVIARRSGDRIALQISDAISGLTLDNGAAPLVIVGVNAIAEEQLRLLPGQEATLQFTAPRDLSSVLPPEGDFEAIIIDALDGDDLVTVGPTVIKSVWADGGRGDDRIEFVPGTPILVDRSEKFPDPDTGGVNPLGRNDERVSAYDLGAIDPSVAKRFLGLTLDSPTDEDWYTFTLTLAPGQTSAPAGATVTLTSLSADDRLELKLVTPNNSEIAATVVGQRHSVSLAGLAAGTYAIHVKSERIPTRYEIAFDGGAAGGSSNPSNNTRDSATIVDDPRTLDRIVGASLRGADEDWYKFTLPAAPTSGNNPLLDRALSVSLLAANRGVTVELYRAGAEDPLLSLAFGAAGSTLDIPLWTENSRTYSLPNANAPDGIETVTVVTREPFVAGDHYLRVVFAAGVPQPEDFAAYEVAFTIDGGGDRVIDIRPTSSGQTVDLSSQLLDSQLDRRDILLGGEGDDVLSGGLSEDWVFGGAGNDVLTGGADNQATDLLFGGAGDDTFQVVTSGLPLAGNGRKRVDANDQGTFVPTQSDWFNGGAGNDRVLFLGGDLDAQGRVVPDEVSVRYNTLLHRYEVATRPWDVEEQRFAVQDDFDSGVTDLYHYAFFQVARNQGTPTVESFEILTRAGDDAVYAAPERRIQGSEWGIDPEDRPQGASLINLTIDGGAGDDRLFGGAGNDTIRGGAGQDVIVGGGGDDRIDGGDGRDWVAGGTESAPPDRYEFTALGPNDSIDRASFAPVDWTPLLSGGSSSIAGLSFGAGDTEDWFAIAAPPALKSFGESSTARLTLDMVKVRLAGQSSTLDASQLIAARKVGDTYVPVAQFAGVPEYYIVGVKRQADPDNGYSYDIEFDGTRLGKTTDVAAGGVSVGSTGVTPVVIPVGDFDGDGADDFIGSVRPVAGAWEATLYFGSNTPGQPIGSRQLVLVLSENPLSVDSDAARSIIAAGDFNGDGKSDIAVALSNSVYRVYIVLGREVIESAGRIDVPAQHDVLIESPADGAEISLAYVGDLNLDGAGDIAVGWPGAGSGAGQVDVYFGSESWQLRSEPLSANFDGYTPSTTEAQATTAQWHLTPDGGYRFGNNRGNYDDGRSLGTLTSREIDLSTVSTGTPFAVRFNYSLDVEASSSHDIASVVIKADNTTGPVIPDLVIATKGSGLVNSGDSLAFTLFDNESVGGRTLSEFRDKRIKIEFRFDTVDGIANTFAGWTVEDVVLETAPRAIQTANATFSGESGFGRSVAGLRTHAATPGELAVLGDTTTIAIYAASSSFSSSTAPTSVELPDVPDGHVLRALGNINGGTLSEFAVTPPWGVATVNTASSYVINRSGVVTSLAGVRDLVGVGDINGDAFDDVGAAILETTQSLAGSPLQHAVGAIVLGGAEALTPAAFTAPAIVVEPARPLYLAEPPVAPFFFASPGDVDGSGHSDFAIADTLGGSTTHVLLSRLLIDPPEVDPSSSRTEHLYAFELATPTVTPDPVSRPPAISFAAGGTQSIAGAPSVVGAAGNQLDRVITLGDSNADGHDDYLVAGPSGVKRLVYGPINLDGVETIDALAENFDASSTPSSTSALIDINGDGYAETLFTSFDSTSRLLTAGVERNGVPVVRLNVLLQFGVNGDLDPTGGDFDGDGKFDLAVTETTYIGELSEANLLTGQTYLFFDVLSKADPTSFTIADADLVLTSGGDLGVLTTSPLAASYDLNEDGFDDLVVGAAFADTLNAGLQENGGRVFIVYGHARGASPVPAGVVPVPITNRTVTGSGDFLVNPANGRPVTVTPPPTSSQDRWHTFTTLGDGLPGNYLSVGIDRPTDLTLNPRATASVSPAGVVTPSANTTPVGPSTLDGPTSTAVLEFDLSPGAHLTEDLDRLLASARLTLGYATEAHDFPSSFDFSVGKVATVGGRLFVVGDDALWSTDGTVVGTRRIAGVSAPDKLTVVGSDLWFFSAEGLQVVPNAATSLAASVKGAVFTTAAEAVAAGPRIVFAHSGGLWTATTGGTPTQILDIANAQVVSNAQALTVLNSDVYFFANGRVAGNSLWRLASGSGVATERLGGIEFPDPEDSYTVPTGGVPTLRIPEIVTVASTGEIFFTDGNSVRRINSAGTVLASSTHGTPASSLTEFGGALFYRAEANNALYRFGSANAISPVQTPGQTTTFTNLVELRSTGGALYATGAWNDGNRTGAELLVVENATGATPQLRVVRDIAPGPASSDPRSLTNINGTLYFTASDGVDGRELWKSDGTSTGTQRIADILQGAGDGLGATQMVAAGTNVYYTANNGSSDARDGLWKTPLAATAANAVFHDLGGRIKVELLADEGDLIPTTEDLSPLQTRVFASATLAVSPRSGVAQFDGSVLFSDGRAFTQVLRDAYDRGYTRLTVRISTPDSNVRYDLGADTASDTEIKIASPELVLADVYAADGRLVARDEPLVDMRSMDAGTYYVRVHGPLSAGYTIEIEAPFAGQTRALYDGLDRDTVRGGDGADVVIGNEGRDRLFGDGGVDQFVADPHELRDYLAGENLTDPSPDESLPNDVKRNIDPQVEIPDDALRLAIGEALNLLRLEEPTQLIRPLVATDLAKLTYLDASWRGVTSLTGLEFAYNLRTLVLSGNNVSDLAPLEAGRFQGIEFDDGQSGRTANEQAAFDLVGSTKGAGLLRQLVLDSNPIADMGPIGLALELRSLSVDYADLVGLESIDGLLSLERLSVDQRTPSSSDRIETVEPIDGLGRLRTLSLTNQQVSDIHPLETLTNLEHVFLRGNSIKEIGSFAGQRLADDDQPGVTDDEFASSRYREVDANGIELGAGATPWRGNLNPAEGKFHDDYRFTESSTVQLLPGDYNGDGAVNTADYTVWRDTLGRSGYQAADGDGSRTVDQADFGVWTGNYGATGETGLVATSFAEWTFEKLTAGTYQVFVSWPEHSNRAPDAHYTVARTVEGGTSEFPTLTLSSFASLGVVDQRLTPSDGSLGGVMWEEIGGRLVVGSLDEDGRLVVRLGNDAHGVVAADAVRLVRVDTNNSLYGPDGDTLADGLVTLDLRDNPLGNDAHDVFLDYSAARGYPGTTLDGGEEFATSFRTAAGPLTVLATANPVPPIAPTIEPQSINTRQPLTIDLSLPPTIADEVFAPATWVQIPYGSGTGSIVGDTPSIQRGTISAAADASKNLVQIFTGERFEPLLVGDIESIAFSMRLDADNQVVVAPAVRQGSKTYYAPAKQIVLQPGPWQTYDFGSVNFNDFIEIVAGSPNYLFDSHPDFTAGGAPIEAGYFTAVSNGGAATWGLDDFVATADLRDEAAFYTAKTDTPAIQANQQSLVFSDSVIGLPKELIDARSQFTFETWVKTIPAGHNAQQIVTAYGPNDEQFEIILSDGFEIVIVVPDNVHTAGRFQVPSLQDGQWHHLAVTFDATADRVTLIFDGVDMGAHTGIEFGVPSVTSIVMGQTTGPDGSGYNSTDEGFSFNRFFTGQIDEVRWWEGVRTPAEIRDNMNRRLTGVEPNLLASYTFDDAQHPGWSQNRVYDLVAFGDGEGSTSTEVRPAPTLTSDVPPAWLTNGDTGGVSVEIAGDQLVLTPVLGFTGTARVTVTAHDGPTSPGDYRGRTTERSFDVTVPSISPTSPPTSVVPGPGDGIYVTRDSLATAPSGLTAQVWSGVGPTPGSTTGVFLKTTSPTGSVTFTQVRSLTAGHGEADATVAVNAEGQIVVAWTEPNAAGGKDVYVRRISSNGDLLGDAIQANDRDGDAGHDPTDRETQPVIAIGADGRFVVVWQSESESGDVDPRPEAEFLVAQTRYRLFPTAAGSGGPINSLSGENRYFATGFRELGYSVAFNEANEVLIARTIRDYFRTFADPLPSIHVTFLNDVGTIVREGIAIKATDSIAHAQPVVLTRGGDDWTIVFRTESDRGDEIAATPFNTATSFFPLDDPLSFGLNGDFGLPIVSSIPGGTRHRAIAATNYGGGHLVGWYDDGDGDGSRWRAKAIAFGFSADGQLRAPAPAITLDSAGLTQSFTTVAIAAAPNGQFITQWEESGPLQRTSVIRGGAVYGQLEITADPTGVAREGVQIELLRAGVVVARTLTDANGDYSFTNLALGDYTVREGAMQSTADASVTLLRPIAVGIDSGLGTQAAIASVRTLADEEPVTEGVTRGDQQTFASDAIGRGVAFAAAPSGSAASSTLVESWTVESGTLTPTRRTVQRAANVGAASVGPDASVAPVIAFAPATVAPLKGGRLVHSAAINEWHSPEDPLLLLLLATAWVGSPATCRPHERADWMEDESRIDDAEATDLAFATLADEEIPGRAVQSFRSAGIALT